MIFVKRPRFAVVMAIVLSLAGLISLSFLPVAQYPSVAPPRIVAKCSYPGANAEEVMRAVGVPLEEGLNGVEGMLFMTSGSNDAGGYSASVTFEVAVKKRVIFSVVN